MIKLNLKCKIILEEYEQKQKYYNELEGYVNLLLKKAVHDAGIEVMAIESRVKKASSLQKKIELKGDKYNSLSDITDILGTRIICYFSDDVDKAAALIQNMFEVDFENSVDKRAVLNPDSFGYLSLHYIVSIPENKNHPRELSGLKFEIQVRSILQHTWAVINHDLGYKTEFGIPKSITRDFSRVAGLLEIADDQFVAIKNNINNYSREIKSKITDNNAQDVLIDVVSLREYVKLNKEMISLINEIAEIHNSKINWIDPQSFVEQLAFLNIITIGDLQIMLERNRNLALQLAKKELEGIESDMLPSVAGLRFICRAELLNKNYPLEKIVEFINISVLNQNRAGQQAMSLMKIYNKICEEN